MDDQNEQTAQFVAMTAASADEATQYLQASNWNLEAAAQSYYADEDERAAASQNAEAPSNYTGPRTLDGRPAPQAIPTMSSSSSSSKRPQKKKGLATLSSLGNDSGHDHDDSNGDDDYDDDDHRDTYAGGEKSGLAVQDPNQRSDDPRDVVKKIIKEAENNSARQDPFPPAGPSSSSNMFRGTGQTLGGEGSDSRVVPGPRAPETVQERTLHIWLNGMSVGDDGPLLSYDDPATRQALSDINREEVPPHLFNVRPGERVNLKLVRHDENYRALPRQYVPFGSQGRRLGSVVPGDSAAAPASSAATPVASSSTPTSQVDESQPTVTIRIQMPDGTRLPARFNTTQTIQDVYDFVSSASAELRAGGWVLATTFPPKDFTDKSLALGDVAEFKRGGTAVIKRSS